MVNVLPVPAEYPVPPMKITFVLPFAGLTGGIRVVSVYAKALAERGHDVRVVSQPNAPASLRDRLRAVVYRRKLNVHVGTSLFAPLGDRHKILETCRPATADDLEDADVVVATWWETAEWVAKLPPSKGRKVYLLQDYEMFPHLPHDRIAATYHAGFKMIAVSSYIRKTISENHGATDIDLVLNGVDTQHFDAPPRDRNSSVKIGFLYQRGERKNMPLALEIVRKAKARIPGLEVVAFGSSPPPHDDPLPDHVKFESAPPQSRIPSIYASCDAWILPSRKEGFGLPLLEAMACRTPVLATRFGASEDIIVNGCNGWLLPSDAEAFVDKIALVRQMPHADWKRMSEQARATAITWQWKTRVDQFEQRLAGYTFA